MEVRVGDAVVDLSSITVEETDRVFQVPSMSNRDEARLGERVELLGYDLATDSVAPGETLTMTLYWRTLVEMRTDYTVFTHLLAPDGSMTGQRDNQPVGGTYPTSLWVPGEVIRDVYKIPVHAEASAGAHRLEVGMYAPATGTRLSVEGSPVNAVSLRTITVTD